MAKHPHSDNPETADPAEGNVGPRAVETAPGVGPRPVGGHAAPSPAQPPAPAGASYDADGNLTRAGMERVVAGGGTILHKGTLIATREQLPSEADLVGNDEQAAENAQRGIDQRQAALDRERATLEKRRADAAAKKNADAKGPESKK